MSTVEERSFVEEARREKRAALEAAGVPAFAYRYERTHSASAALGLYHDEMGEDGPERAPSPGGSTAWARTARRPSRTSRTSADGSRSTSARTRWARAIGLVGLLDLDDHVGVEGTLFRTKKGEITVKAERGDAAREVAPAAAARKDAADR